MAFSDHERKLFRQRFVLGPLAAGGGLLAVALISLQVHGWWYALVFAAMLVWIIAAIGLAATEHATNLKRFDAVLAERDRQAAIRLRRRKMAARLGVCLAFFALIYVDRLNGHAVAILAIAVAGALCGVYANWMFRRETAIVRTVAGLAA